MKRYLLLAAIIVSVLAVSCSKYKYEKVAGDPLKTRIYTLDNGLKVYMSVNRETPRIQTYIAVRVGGKNDPAETTGLAHYFEHLMFKGTQHFGTTDYAAEKPLLDQIEQLFEVYRKTTDEAQRAALYHQIDSISYEASKIAIPNEYDKLMSAIGANGTNAYTSYDQTVYVEDIPSNQIDNWAKIQADRFKNIVIRGFHTELETIYEEKNMSLTSDGRKVYENILSSLFPNHPYGRQTVLGTQESLKNPSITNVKMYHDTYYVPNNMAICLSGDFDPEQMIATIDKYFGDMQPNENLPKLQFETEQPITEPVVRDVYGLDAQNITLAWRMGGAATEDADLAQLMGEILYNGQAGLLDLDLNQQQKVLGAYGYPIIMADYGAFILAGRPKEGQTLDQVKELLMEEVAKLRAGEFDEHMLQAVINNRKLQIEQYLDSNDGRADAYVNAFINGLDWKDEVQQLDRLGKITKEQVVAFANRILGDRNMAVIYKHEGKDPDEQKISKPKITPIATNRDARSAFLEEVQASEVKPIEPVFVDFNKDMSRLEAQAGIPVLYKKNETTSLFNLMYVIETGTNSDPALNLAFQYLDYLGTSQKSAEQIKQEFYNIACAYGISAGSDRSYVTLSGLSENMPAAMQLFEELVADAQPDEAILANLKADMIKARADAKLNQGANFGALNRYATFGPEFIRKNTLTDEQLMALTSEELLERVKAFANLEHKVLYYGPKSGNEVVADLKANHRTPEKLTPVAVTEKAQPLLTPENRVILAEYDAKQLYFLQVSNRGEQFDPSNDAAIALYNEYFGGGMNAIVFQEMREARSLAYTAQAFLNEPARLDRPYMFMAFIATQNDKMGDAIEAFEQIINNMPESEAAFNLAKESLIARMRTDRTIKSGVLWSYLRAQDLGLDYDRDKAIFEQVQTLTLDDVKAAQQKWVKDRNYTYCILGDSKDLDLNYLRQIGPLQFVSQEEIFGY